MVLVREEGFERILGLDAFVEQGEELVMDLGVPLSGWDVMRFEVGFPIVDK